jgi:hypothetical protein
VRARITAALAAIIVAAVAWLVLASMAIVAAFGFWSIYPWPGRGWMWLRYLLEARENPIVHRWLWLTGVAAALPVIAVGTGALRVWLRNGVSALYGKTGWATQKQMRATGWELRNKP